MNTTHRLVAVGVAALVLGAGVGSSLFSPRAQADASQSTPVRIATVDVLTLVEKLASSDRYLPAREEKVRSLRAPIDQINRELDDLRVKITAFPDFQNNAEAQPLIQQFQTKSQNLQQLQQTAQNEAESFNAMQIQEAHRLVVESVGRLAASRGYTHVLASKPSDSRMTSANVLGTLQEMLARPVVVAGATDDLTAELIKELKLENVNQPAPAAAPEAPLPAPR